MVMAPILWSACAPRGGRPPNGASSGYVSYCDAVSDSPAPAAPTTWDADGFRHQVQAALEQFLDRQAAESFPIHK